MKGWQLGADKLGGCVTNLLTIQFRKIYDVRRCELRREAADALGR